MKINTQRLRTLLGFAAISGFSMVPLAAIAQEPHHPAPPPPPAAGDQRPDLEKVRGMVREMMELRRAGKHDEANRMAERIRAATGNDPRVVGLLEQNRRHPGPDGQTREPRKPVERPNAKEDEREKEAKDKEKEKEHKAKELKAKELKAKELKAKELKAKELKAKELKAKELKEKAKEHHAEKKPSKDSKTAEINPVERIRHMRVAAEHLDAAGIEGMAKVVRAQIAGMEKRMQHAEAAGKEANSQPHRGRAGATERPMRFGQRPNMPPMGQGPRFGGPPPQWGGSQSPGMQPQPQAGPRDPNAALIGEIRKLRQEMGEIRSQVKRLQSNEGSERKQPK